MFSLFPSDPKKALIQSTGLAILAGADPGQALASLPQQIAEAQMRAQEMDLRKKQLGIQEEDLRMRLDEAGRNQEIFNQKAALGKALEAYNLSPNNFGGFAPEAMGPAGTGQKPMGINPEAWSANDMVQRQFKGDAAMPIGEEGNPMAKQIMGIPLALRQGLAQAPQAAADIMAPGLQAAMTNALETGGSSGGRAPNIVNLQDPNGNTQSFDLGDPTQRQNAIKATQQGWVEVNPQTPRDQNAKIVNMTDGDKTITLNMANPDHEKKFNELSAQGWMEAPTKTLTSQTTDPTAQFDEPYTAEVKASSEQAMALESQVDDLTVLGSLLLRPDIYTGTGAGVVNTLGKGLKDTLGLFGDIDFSNPVIAAKKKKELALGLKKTLLKGDTQMSNNDREYLDSIIVGVTDGADGISRGIALKMLESRYANEKAQFLQEAIRDRKLGSYKALQEWNKVRSGKMREIFNPERVEDIMQSLMAGANDQSLLDYTSERLPKAEGQLEQKLGIQPSPQGVVELKGASQAELDAQYEQLPSGAEFVGPDGVKRRKP